MSCHSWRYIWRQSWVLRTKIIVIGFLTCSVFSTQICLRVLMEVSVPPESCATAVDLMQLDQDAKQVCKGRRLTGFLGLYSGYHSYKNDYLCRKVPSCPSTFPFLWWYFIAYHVHSISYRLNPGGTSQVTLLLSVHNTGAERDHICRTWGQYNFETFDGLYYYFSGKSTYALVRHTELDGQSFSIQVGDCTSLFLLTLLSLLIMC